MWRVGITTRKNFNDVYKAITVVQAKAVAPTNERGRVVSERDVATALDAELVSYKERSTISLTLCKWEKKHNCTVP